MIPMGELANLLILLLLPFNLHLTTDDLSDLRPDRFAGVNARHDFQYKRSNSI
jgi:hypothetical protein